MKNGKRPTVNQSIFIEKNWLDPKEFLVVKDTPTFIQLVRRKPGKPPIIIFKD